MAEEAQKKRKRKRRKKHYLLRLIAIIAAGVGLYCLLSSSIFDVQGITVESNSYYTKEQIISKADAKAGDNIFGVKTKKIKEALLKDPYIKNARVKRTLPGTVVIIVEERSESAAVPFAGAFIILDGDGLVLRKTDVEPKLPLITGMVIKTMDEGKPIETEETGALTGSLKIVGAMEETGVYFKRIDISTVAVKAYIYDQLICQGTPENILKSMENGNLETFVYHLYTKGTERGIINVGSGNEFPFSPWVE
ncbi:MAG: FtsQ-type POTRA domain-containing protein [Clostridiales bacterium]|nr:FtsQ-type POTRA domain-containing protein [Clostridiales bacterium]